MNAINCGWYSVYYDSTVSKGVAQHFADTLPHGSGIDGDWNLSKTPNYYHVYNIYSAMNDVGYYCHDWGFIAMFDDSFKLCDVIVDGNADDCDCRYDLDDYLFQVLDQ